MNRGPRPGTPGGTDFVAKARAAWSDEIPDWVLALAEEAQRTTVTAVAALIGYSPAVVSQVLSATYRGDLPRVEQVVRGALMGTIVACPVLGDIGRDACLREQARPFKATNSTRAMLRRACRTCPNARRKS